MDTQLMTVEHFEPHGNRGQQSKLNSITRGYMKTSKNLRLFFKQYFPKYKFISPKDYEKQYGLQIKTDLFKGVCVTWCILYIHYRILNPDTPINQLIKHIDKKVTKRFMLRYMKYIEDTLKHKI